MEDTKLDTELMGRYAKVACTVLDDWLCCSKGCAILTSTSTMRKFISETASGYPDADAGPKDMMGRRKAVVKTQ